MVPREKLITGDEGLELSEAFNILETEKKGSGRFPFFLKSRMLSFRKVTHCQFQR